MHGSRSMSEARNPIFSQKSSNNSNRNSLKETNSNRSSMDMATSYNTLIIHDDSLYNSAADFMLGNSSTKKDKDRPRSFGTDQVIKEILEIPDDYNENSVLKQLVKELKLPNRLSGSGGGASGNQACQSNMDVPENDCHRPPPKYVHASGSGVEQKGKGQVQQDEEDEVDSDESGDQAALSKLKSKSQPDLSRIIDIDLDTIEVLVFRIALRGDYLIILTNQQVVLKENVLLKQQLSNCYKKVARTKKVSTYQ